MSTTTIRTAVVNSRIPAEHAAELRRRAREHESTVSRQVAAIIRREFERTERSEHGDAA